MPRAKKENDFDADKCFVHLASKDAKSTILYRHLRI
jgi:hypothetical protein